MTYAVEPIKIHIMKSKSAKPEYKRFQIIMLPELFAASDRKAEANGETLGAMIRRLLAAEVNRPALAEMPPRGKPPKKADS